MNRKARLAARRNRGLARPGPVRVRVVNLASVSSRPATVRRILDASLARLELGNPAPDLILGVECADVTIRDLVDGGVWQVVQFGRSLSDEGERVARSGCALLARRGVVKLDKPRLRLGSAAGEGIRDRYILTARATFHRGDPSSWRSWVRVGHAPPPRAPFGRGRFLDALRELTGIRGGDLNISAETTRRMFPRPRVRSAGVLHLLTPAWIRTGNGRRVDVGSDHAALDVTLWGTR
jgi:hypothetical protein